MKLIMTKGLPGSGKSTWAKQLSRNNQQYIRINKDSLREMIGYTLHRENLVVEMRNALIRVGLKAKKHVIVDDTNLDPKHEFNLRKLANECGAEFELNDSFLEVPLKTCIKQDLKRTESVGKDVILRMHKQYLAPKARNAWSHDPTLQDAIICDIDGTLAIHVARSPYEMEKCETDALDTTIASIIRAEYERGRRILLVSGREDCYREATWRWLKKQRLDLKITELHMRPTGDHREDSIIKQEIFDREIKRKYNVMYVLDDRNRVVEMWRQNGLKCLQVAEGDF